MADDRMLKTGRLSDAEMDEIRALKAKKPDSARVSLILYARSEIRAVSLAEGESLVIGRGAPADIILRDGSLSRQHARLELKQGQVWVEDLDSTNGSCIDGDPIERAPLQPDAELTLGTVSAHLHILGDASSSNPGLENHEHFVRRLEAEAARARTFGRSLALILLRQPGHLGGWFTSMAKNLRPFDLAGLYASNTVEILLPECDQAQALSFVEKSSKADQSLRCGLAVLPAHASSAGELMDLAREALQQADAAQTIRSAKPAGETPAASSGTRPIIQNPAMLKLFDRVAKLAKSKIPVLIFGETGTGKEVVARAIHSTGPLRIVNCGAIPPQLIESTLFGHEKGAFTGAEHRQVGVFEAASGGTVFLDEIGELPAQAQAALLRVLENKVICRVGSNDEIEVAVRVLAATHQDLGQMVKTGEFREDLLYRLNAMTLEIPPLRERTEEIQAFVEHFIEQARQAEECTICGIEEEALDLLKKHEWPGNVRELKNAIERAVVLTGDKQITVDDLPEAIQQLESEPASPPRSPSHSEEINLKAELTRHEGQLILEALKAADWDRKNAAKTLGLPLRTLAHKMRIHGIKRLSYEQDPKA
ncbi:MAG: sigma 54-interacting transcriptional regulator [Deltaproteobacteria bacterium]|nr:sigma 54-interacting transcriptional regulator [Deltaproteobacteria bacterium]